MKRLPKYITIMVPQRAYFESVFWDALKPLRNHKDAKVRKVTKEWFAILNNPKMGLVRRIKKVLNSVEGQRSALIANAFWNAISIEIAEVLNNCEEL